MINDQQVKKLRSDLNGGMRLAAAALRSGMSEKTARKYRNMNQLPSGAQQPHHWRTRIAPANLRSGFGLGRRRSRVRRSQSCSFNFSCHCMSQSLADARPLDATANGCRLFKRATC